MFSGPPGLTSAYSVEISIFAGPAGRRLFGADLRPLDDEQVVLVTEVAVVEIAREAAAGAS
jgi:hypothetical protein